MLSDPFVTAPPDVSTAPALQAFNTAAPGQETVALAGAFSGTSPVGHTLVSSGFFADPPDHKTVALGTAPDTTPPQAMIG